MKKSMLVVAALALLLPSIPVFAANSCLAVRGNGQSVTAHWAALGKILETHEPFYGGVGGSSGSITLFLYESMMLNPAIKACDQPGDRPGVTCTVLSESQRAQRISLLFKSMMAYIEVVRGEEEIQALVGAYTEVQKILAAFDRSRNRRADSRGDIEKASFGPATLVRLVSQLYRALNSSEISGLLNPEFLHLVSPFNLVNLRSPDDHAVKMNNLREAYRGLSTFGKFSTDDKRILFRPGVLSFYTVAERLGRAGNFFAGRGSFYDRAGVTGWIERCTPKALGNSWSELQAKDSSCHAQAVRLMSAYRDRIRAIERDAPRVTLIPGLFPKYSPDHATPRKFPESRLWDNVGQYLNMMVSSAVLTPAEAVTFRTKREVYKHGAGEFDPSNASFATPPFSGFIVKYGYWGRASSSAAINANAAASLAKSLDVKSQHGMGMGPLSWRDAIARSVSEPGLASILDGTTPHDAHPDQAKWPATGETLVSAAGWTDLSPVQASKANGCGEVVYLTRAGADSNFGRGVARLFGASQNQDRWLFDLADGWSSFNLAIKAADSVYCTNWNDVSAFDLKGVEKDAYHDSEWGPWTQSKYAGCGGTEPPPKEKPKK